MGVDDITMMNVQALADLLHEAEEHHGPYEKLAQPHNWWDWYAAYVSARQSGDTPAEASATAGHHMKEAFGVLPR